MEKDLQSAREQLNIALKSLKLIFEREKIGENFITETGEIAEHALREIDAINSKGE